MLAHLLSQLFVISVQILLMLLFVLLVFKVNTQNTCTAHNPVHYESYSSYHPSKSTGLWVSLDQSPSGIGCGDIMLFRLPLLYTVI